MQPEEIKIEDPFAENAPLDGMNLSLPALPAWAAFATSDTRHASPTAHYGSKQPQTLTGGDLDGPARVSHRSNFFSEKKMTSKIAHELVRDGPR